jgi:hypothetical protein
MFDGAVLRRQALQKEIGFDRFVAAYLEWLTRAQQAIAEASTVADANSFNSLPPPHLENTRDSRSAIYKDLERRLDWFETTISARQQSATQAGF